VNDLKQQIRVSQKNRKESKSEQFRPYLAWNKNEHLAIQQIADLMLLILPLCTWSVSSFAKNQLDGALRSARLASTATLKHTGQIFREGYFNEMNWEAFLLNKLIEPDRVVDVTTPNCKLWVRKQKRLSGWGHFATEQSTTQIVPYRNIIEIVKLRKKFFKVSFVSNVWSKSAIWTHDLAFLS